MLAAIPFPDLSPDIFSVSVFGMTFALRWYAVAYLLGLILGWQIILRLMRRPHLWPGNTAPMQPAQVEELLTAVVIGVILGGRLGYVLFYKPMEYLARPQDILKVWEGGMSFHGGFLGVMVAGLWFCRRHKLPALSVSDAMAVVAPIGLLLGRIANFINAELWGRPTDMPWGVVFPGAEAQDCGTLIEACARHPSQLYEAGLEGLLLGLILWIVVAKGGLARAGMATGIFLLGYGLSRFVVEFFRQADAQFITPDNPLGHYIQLGGAGLSMGQLLSLPMILGGIWFIQRAKRA